MRLFYYLLFWLIVSGMATVIAMPCNAGITKYYFDGMVTTFTQSSEEKYINPDLFLGQKVTGHLHWDSDKMPESTNGSMKYYNVITRGLRFADLFIGSQSLHITYPDFEITINDGEKNDSIGFGNNGSQVFLHDGYMSSLDSFGARFKGSTDIFDNSSYPSNIDLSKFDSGIINFSLYGAGPIENYHAKVVINFSNIRAAPSAEQKLNKLMITDTAIYVFFSVIVTIFFAYQYAQLKSFKCALCWLIWNFPGWRFIFGKVVPLREDIHSATLCLWVVGIYVTAFGIASNRHQNAVDRIENRANVFITQLATIKESDIKKKAWREMVEIQHMACPKKPDILSPISVIDSFRKSKFKPYSMVNDLMIRTAEQYKFKLQEADLRDAKLNGAMDQSNLEKSLLDRANFEKANLTKSNFKGARLIDTNFRDAMLSGADFQNANLIDTDFSRSNLQWAVFKGAIFNGTIFKDADLTNAEFGESFIEPEQLCSAKSLYKVKLLYRGQENEWLMNRVKLICPEKLDPSLRNFLSTKKNP